MRWQLLGQVQLREPGTGLRVTPKARTVLALLLCRRDSVVPVSALCDELWGDRLPKSARTTVQTYVVHLRRALAQELGTTVEQVAEQTLTTCGQGYRLMVDVGEVDTSEFCRLSREGAAAREAGRYQEAVACFQDALALWNGPPLADVPCGLALDAEVARLNEAHLAVEEQMVALHLDLGHSHEALGEIAGMVRRHPANENMHALQMIALHRVGRRSDALKTFHQLRSTLVDELAMEPTKSLQALYQAVLASDPMVQGLQATTTFLSQ